MQYLGGKSRIAKQLATILNPAAKKAGMYIEPFVGGASVICQIDSSVLRVGRDANEALITMWQALAQGWQPPRIVSEEEYHRVKAIRDPKDPLTAFIGFGCCFGGTWWGGYARNSIGQNYADAAASSLRKKLRLLSNVYWAHSDYRTAFYELGAVLYCDPPYYNTSAYKAIGHFDSTTFWDFCREKSQTNPVFISEYQAPDDFECILAIPTKLSVRSKAGCEPRVEKLFIHKSCDLF